MKSNTTSTKSGSRGTKIVQSTGLDNSSHGPTGMSSMSPKMGGGKDDLSHTIKDGKVPN